MIKIALGVLLLLVVKISNGQHIQLENTITSGSTTNQHTSRDNGVTILPLANGGSIVLGTSTGSMGNDKSENGFFYPVAPNTKGTFSGSIGGVPTSGSFRIQNN